MSDATKVAPEDHQGSEIPLTLVEENVAIKDPSHLKRWLSETKRDWLIVNFPQLIDALPWPHGCEALIQILDALRHHRSVIPTGETVYELDPIVGDRVGVPEMHGECLTVSEMDRVVRYLITKITEVDPNWSLSSSPL